MWIIVIMTSSHSPTSFLGLYYPPDSFKTRFCIRGRSLLKDYCQTRSVPVAWPGKLVVATGQAQTQYIEKLHSHAQILANLGPGHPPPRTKLISGDEARIMQPDLSNEITAALLSHDTGIVDSHTLMQALEADIGESEGGDLALGTSVVRVDPVTGPEQGWVVQVVTGDSNATQGDAIFARNLINASGLSANLVLNSLARSKNDQVPLYFARGSYASYRGPGVGKVSTLIYPVPVMGGKKNDHGFHGLGTHLTLDMGGNVRFGPDVEWIEPRVGTEEDETTIGFWQEYLRPEEDHKKLQAMHEAVTEFLPGVKLDGLSIDYAGIRPKTGQPTSGFQDFEFRINYANGTDSTSEGPMITLLGIESPGLTSALAIAEHVEVLLYRDDSNEFKE